VKEREIKMERCILTNCSFFKFEMTTLSCVKCGSKISCHTTKLYIKLDHLLLFSLLPFLKSYFDSLINTTSQPVIDTTLSVRDILNLTGDWNHDFLNESLHVINTTNLILAILAHTDKDGPYTIG
jgi:hypothetical protein